VIQQVNLYQPAVRKRWGLFSFQMTLAVVLLLLPLFGMLFYFEREVQQKVAKDLQIIKLQEEEKLTEIENLQSKLQPQDDAPQLEQKVELLKGERRQKVRILSRLQDQAISNTGGFSTYLEGLARKRIPELWLTQIRIDDGGEQMFLNGSALQPDLVPKYLQRLATEVAFKDRVFQTFTLTRPEGEAWRVDFSIGTKVDEEKVEK